MSHGSLACVPNVLDGTIGGAFNALYGESQMNGFQNQTGLALDLRFADLKTLDDRITFTRASTGTYIDSAGLVQSASTNVARFTHDPSTLASLGLLIEESRTNLLLRSEEIDNASWTKSGVTVTQNNGTSPDGATTAESVTATSTGTAVRFVIQSTTKAASAIQYAYSFWAKAVAGGRYITFSVDDGLGNGFGGGLDLSTGQTTGGLVGTGGAFTSVSAVQHVNGWWKVVVIGTTNIITTLRVAVNLAASLTTGYPSATLTAGDGILLWGAQIEAGAFATSYIPTTTASATRAADVATITGTNFSSWFRQDEGTFVCGFRRDASASTFEIFEANDGTNSNRIASRLSKIGESNLRLQGPGVNIDTTGSTKVALGSSAVTAIGYATGNTALVFQGVVQVQSGLGLPVGLAQLRIGSGSAGCPNSPIARIRYFRRRLPNSMLQVLTA